VLGAGFALIAANFSEDFAILTASWANFTLFTVGVMITGMVLVLDQALLGLLRGSWQMWRNAVFATSKLLLLIPGWLLFSSGWGDGDLCLRG
jgi:TRAP-type uncharacterized transport system fused permease subunit